MTDQTEQTADELQTGQDAPVVETAPEVATEAEAATDPLSPAADAPPAEVDINAEPNLHLDAALLRHSAHWSARSTPVLHALYGVQSAPADHPRRVAYLAGQEAPAPEADEA